MAREHTLELWGQPVRHSVRARRFSVYFSEPERGIDPDTGILLLLSGYGGNARSNIYIKMREQFADNYNFVTLQCDYLGYEFMQDDHYVKITPGVMRQALSDEEIRLLLADYRGNRHILRGKQFTRKVMLGETGDCYNEMGLWQAMDNLRAVKIVLDIMKENGVDCRYDRVYAYGQSHGAYLAYLCNFLAPGLFHVIIDNSAYLFPEYLSKDREVIKQGEWITLRKLYHYRVQDIEIDEESYDLRRLYTGFDNYARILSFHGEDDAMIPLAQKKDFLMGCAGTMLYPVTEKEVDGLVFSDTSHGLGADFIKMFALAMELCSAEPPVKEGGFYEQDKLFRTAKYTYQLKWEEGMPMLFFYSLY